MKKLRRLLIRLTISMLIAFLAFSAFLFITASPNIPWKLPCSLTTTVSNTLGQISVNIINFVHDNASEEAAATVQELLKNSVGLFAIKVAEAGGCIRDSDCAYYPYCVCKNGACYVAGCNGDAGNICPWCCSCDNGHGSGPGPVTCTGAGGQVTHNTVLGCKANPTKPAPQPTATQGPTATPVPTSTPIPTATPVPTSTPIPTATSIPPTPRPTHPPRNKPPEEKPTATTGSSSFSPGIYCEVQGIVPGKPVCRWYAMEYIGQVLGEEVKWALQERNYFSDLPRGGEFTLLIESLALKMDWYQTDLWCNSNGRRFCPNMNLTRGEAARWTELMAFGPANDGEYLTFFADVSPTYKYSNAISHITQRGIYIIGLGPSKYDPNAYILGDQFITLINLAAEAREASN